MPLRRPRTGPAPAEVDYADEKVIHHEEEIRALGEQLDKLLAAPLLGPAKVTLAWNAGYSSVEEFSSASFEELATLPGFGRPVASLFFSKLGRPVPPPPPRAAMPVPVILAPTRETPPAPSFAAEPTGPHGTPVAREDRTPVLVARIPEPPPPPAPEPLRAIARVEVPVALVTLPPAELQPTPSPSVPAPLAEPPAPPETTAPAPEEVAAPMQESEATDVVVPPVVEERPTEEGPPAPPETAAEPTQPSEMTATVAETVAAPEGSGEPPQPSPPPAETAPEPLPEASSPPPPVPAVPVSVPPPAEPPAPPTPPAAPVAPPPLEPAYLPESARPLPEEPKVAPPKVGGLEVELSGALLPALQPFLDATAAGHRGLAVVRELPERIRTLVGPRPVAVYWLSNLARDRTIRPGDLPALSSLLRKGVEANAITAVFLEGVEYLARIHGTGAIAGFLKELDGVAREHEARVWLHLTPGLLSPGDLELIQRELGLPAAEDPSRDPSSSG